MNPTGGVGAINAMHDAVTLANWFATLRVATKEDLEIVFKEYRAERMPVVKDAFEASQLFTRNIGKVLGSNNHYRLVNFVVQFLIILRTSNHARTCSRRLFEE